MDVIEAIPGADVAIAAERVAVTAALPAHGHGFMELVVVASGTGAHRTRSGTRRIGRGEVVLIRPGQWHAYDDPDGLTVWNLYIAARTLTAELAALRSDPLVAALVSAKIADADGGAAGLPAAADPEVIEPHLAALAAPPDRTASDGLMRLGNLLAVLAHLVPVLLARSPDPRPRFLHPAVIAATDLFHDGPGLPWTLPELARRVHVSAPYLCRCFLRDLGISPLRYLERYRLELVAQLLLDSDLTISQISAQAGIADPNYLARRFRAAHGFTPSRYRAAFADPLARRTTTSIEGIDAHDPR
ncbi:MAG TPA: AraC family transcriptional regulator [Streptosporangiaceae bacterium]|nr:AraC family transcriptional regulator [Streptosporangiaceae bacterium]